MGHDISGLHHVGHLVHDMEAALERYRRLGFTLPGPAYPALGDPPQALGVGNTHAYFSANFIELVTVAEASGRIPEDAQLIPLHAPEDRLPALTQAIRGTVANLEVGLRRFEGVHILMFEAADIEVAATRLTASGVRHGGVLATRRPVETAGGTRMEPVQFLELDPVPEGRVGLAVNSTISDGAEHPNGAVELVECVMCVADAELDEVEGRYERYLGRTAPERGLGMRTFGLGSRARLTLVAGSGLDGLLPGESAPALPGFVAYAVAVRDVAATERLLRDRGISMGRTRTGEIFVPAEAAFGAAIIFRQSGRPGASL